MLIKMFYIILLVVSSQWKLYLSEIQFTLAHNSLKNAFLCQPFFKNISTTFMLEGGEVNCMEVTVGEGVLFTAGYSRSHYPGFVPFF